MAFTLHPQLAADTFFIADWPLSKLLLMNDRRYPWLILVPRREDMRDLVDLLPGDQTQLLAEINQSAALLRQKFQPHKLNIAALGNVVAQLHVHIVARQETDAAWPKPVWGIGQREVYEEGEAQALIRALMEGAV